MHPAYIVLISVGAAFAFLFLLWLFLVKPGRRSLVMDKFKSVRYAHRGLHDEKIPENSLAAFKAAVDKGFGIELDVRLSKDGVAVVFHDDTLDRMTAEVGRVDSRSFDELQKITLLESGEKIPSFEEVLDLIDGRVPLLVELKEDAGKYAVTEETLRILKEYKGEYIIESFNPLALGRVKKIMPEVPRGLLSQTFFKEKQYKTLTHFLLQCQLLNFICRPDFIAFRHTDAKNRTLRFNRSVFGAPTLAYTVRSAEEENAAYKNRFDGIIFEGYIPRKN